VADIHRLTCGRLSLRQEPATSGYGFGFKVTALIAAVLLNFVMLSPNPIED
jgi:hypothetical protein